MDLTKFKTVAMRIETYKLLKGLCNKTHRTPAKMISKLIDTQLMYISKKEQIKIDELKKQLLEANDI